MGGGASLLAERLVALGYRRVIVVDISEAALRAARTSMRDRGNRVTWLVADARDLALPEAVDLWHDRALFHFLTRPADQEAYLSSMRRALPVGGYAIIATFGMRGPSTCSGLPVQRYDADALVRRLGPEYELVLAVESQHVTPAKSTQQFTYGLFRRV